MIRPHFRFVIASVAAALAGCNGTMGLGGSSEYACPVAPGVTCESVSNVYRMSREGKLPSKSSRPRHRRRARTPTPLLLRLPAPLRRRWRRRCRRRAKSSGDGLADADPSQPRIRAAGSSL
jgi:hypothetical protein